MVLYAQMKQQESMENSKEVFYDEAQHGSYENFLYSDDRKVQLAQQKYATDLAGPQSGDSINFIKCIGCVHGSLGQRDHMKEGGCLNDEK